MEIKRALVVDDSRAARMSLKSLLSEYDLDVELTPSGEQALEFLKHQSVDVIFMDHTMPGMDGLEAVAAIKANPRTATIPVMMYTTREGEVYVGQARALGAVGVLPKNVQPHQLFEMLLKLDLVAERRGDDRDLTKSVEKSGDSAAQIAVTTHPTEIHVETDQTLDEHARGVAVHAIVQRILEDQHVTLRSDILRSQRAFAKDVAREVLREHHSMELAVLEDEPDNQPIGHTSGGYKWVLSAALVGVMAASLIALQFKYERDQLVEKLGTNNQAHNLSIQHNRSELDQGQIGSAENPLGQEAVGQVGASAIPQGVDRSAIAALQWSLNHDTTTQFYAPAFGAELAQRLRGVLPHLQNLGFKGEIRLTSHLGKFCLALNEQGSYDLAAADTPVSQCAHLGHILDLSNFPEDRMAEEFSNLVEANIPSLQIQLVALYVNESNAATPYPQISANAEHWNAAAQENNRVEVELIPQL